MLAFISYYYWRFIVRWLSLLREVSQFSILVFFRAGLLKAFRLRFQPQAGSFLQGFHRFQLAELASCFADDFGFRLRFSFASFIRLSGCHNIFEGHIASLCSL